MKVATRRVIFFSFLIAFLILAPTLVLFTAGYKYNTQTGRFVRTGALSISSNPRTTSIFLNGEYTGKNAPHVLKRVIPGTYLVELRRDGFIPWSGRTQVSSSATAFVTQPYLLRNDAPFLEEEVAYDELWFSPSGEYVTALHENELFVWQTTDTTPDLSQAVNLSTPVSFVDWSINEDYLAVSDGSTVSLVTAGGDLLLKDLSVEHDRFFFSTTDNQILFVEQNGELMEWNIGTLTSRSVSEERDGHRVDEVLTDGRTLELTYFRDDLSIRDISSTASNTIALLPPGDYRIVQQAGNMLLLQDDTGIVLINLDSAAPIVLERSATLVDWEPSSNILAFSDGFEIALLNMETDEVHVVTRSGSPITGLTLAADGRYVIAASDRQIIAFETAVIGLERFNAVLSENFERISDINLAPDTNQLLIGGVAAEVEGLFIKRLR